MFKNHSKLWHGQTEKEQFFAETVPRGREQIFL